MTINETILYFARKYLGEKELKGNSGFEDSDFQLKMEDCGWDSGQAWCAYYLELIWKEAYKNCDSTMIKELDKLFSAGAVRTWNNFKGSDFVTDRNPQEGCGVIWQNYKAGQPHWTGHAGIVYKVYSDDSGLIETIEGNTNSSGGREGIEVAKKIRPLNFDPKVNGLVLLGFIHPK